MIARIWRGETRAADREAYLAYLERTGLKAYGDTPGNCGVFAFCRDHGDRAEFLLLSLWRDAEAVQAFAGTDADRAVFYPDDERFLVSRDLHVSHFDVVFTGGGS